MIAWAEIALDVIIKLISSNPLAHFIHLPPPLIHTVGHSPKQIEGYQSGNWILMDYRDIIVHVFCKEDRLFYDLERIWRDGKIMDAEEFQ